MANPVAQELTYDITKQGNDGACRRWLMRFPGLGGASDADAGSNLVLYYLQNPIGIDLVITRAWAVITTKDAQDGDIDVGLGDDAAGANVGAEVIDSLVNSATGVLECMATQAVTGVARPVWQNSGADSYLTIVQNGDADCAALKWNLILEVIAYDDMVNSNVDISTVTVA